jgi:chemotaxis protein histidine kinase CheA
LRQLHTIKGNARATGLWQISHAIHRLEDEVQSAEAGGTGLPGEQLLHDLVHEYQHLLNDIFHRQKGKTEGPLYLCDTVRPLIPDLRERLEQAGFQLGRVSVHDAVLNWDASLMPALADVVMHALNNSIDHGFLRSPERAGHEACLDIRAFFDTGDLCLEIEDNGAGLDLAKIKKKAQELNLALPAKDPFSVLFQDGFSTARELSESSGRGVGLSAIAALAQSWNGSVQIQPAESEKGTRLRVRIPSKAAA